MLTLVFDLNMLARIYKNHYLSTMSIKNKNYGKPQGFSQGHGWPDCRPYAARWLGMQECRTGQ
jgi:hypothetical protein